MSTLYDRFARTADGRKHLAVARLRREILRSLHVAMGLADISQNDLAKRLGIRKSAVSQALNGDGNLRVTTVAQYLQAMGYELDLRLVEEGEPRRAVEEHRDVRPALAHRPGQPDSAIRQPLIGETTFQVIETSHAHALISMTLEHADGGGIRFEGEATPVAKARPVTTPTVKSSYQPLRREVVG